MLPVLFFIFGFIAMSRIGVVSHIHRESHRIPAGYACAQESGVPVFMEIPAYSKQLGYDEVPGFEFDPTCGIYRFRVEFVILRPRKRIHGRSPVSDGVRSNTTTMMSASDRNAFSFRC